MKLPQTRFDWIVLTLLAAVLGMAWISMTRVDASDVNLSGLPPSPDIGHPAPDFTLPTPNGGTLSLTDLRGQPVILNFWATWCGPCRVEIPALEAASRRAGSQAVILGVSVQESASTVSAFAAEVGMTYPVALDLDAKVARTYRVVGFPTTYIIDAQGIIVDIYPWPINEPLLNSLIDDLIASTAE